MKRVLVSGYIGFNNFGDEAIFYALSNHLKQLKYNVSVLCNNKTEVENTYKVCGYNYKKPLEILKAILSCDVLISGGGSLLQNKTSNFSLFYYLLIILFSKICFKKVVIFAQGFEKINGFFPAFFTKLILKMVDFVSVRDEKSKKILLNWKINSLLLSDPVYSLVENVEIKKDKTSLLVQLRDFKGINNEFIQNLAQAIYSNYKGEIKVVSFQDEIDEKICLKFKSEIEKLGAKAEYVKNRPINEIIDLLNNTKYVISTRLHGLIVANALKSRTFALSYDDKIDTLCEELNIRNIKILDCDKMELNDKIKSFFLDEEFQICDYRKFNWVQIDGILEK